MSFSESSWRSWERSSSENVWLQMRRGTLLQNLSGSDDGSGFNLKTFWQTLDFLDLMTLQTHPLCFMLGGLSMRTASLIFSSVSWLFLGTTMRWNSACFGPFVVGFRTTWGGGEGGHRGGQGLVSKCLNRYRIISVLSFYLGTKSTNNHQSRSKLWNWQSAVIYKRRVTVDSWVMSLLCHLKQTLLGFNIARQNRQHIKVLCRSFK